jgi:hypothetical protein
VNQSARGRARPCQVKAPAELDLGERECSMVFGPGGHQMLKQDHTPLGLPGLIHQCYDSEAEEWVRWVTYPRPKLLPRVKKQQSENA